ncbi:hypothetical protein [Tomitella biformata]|nr:hypothetical protein [Tomitella biformata]
MGSLDGILEAAIMPILDVLGNGDGSLGNIAGSLDDVLAGFTGSAGA